MRRGIRWIGIAVAVAVGALLLLGVVEWLRTGREAREEEAPVPAVQDVVVPPATPVDAGPASVGAPMKTTPPVTTAHPATSAGRVELPHPAAKPDDSGYAVPPPNTMLRDRRDQPGPHAKRERIAVGYALDTLDEDIEQCLDQWRKTDVTLKGSLMLGIEIDASGAKRAWVESDGGVPLGPQSCFSNAVYGIDWSHMVDSPAMITRPYSFDKDGGT